jgi:hypothetical protein
MLRHVDNLSQPTELVLELTDRLRNALDEIDALQEEIVDLSDYSPPAQNEDLP